MWNPNLLLPLLLISEIATALEISDLHTSSPCSAPFAQNDALLEPLQPLTTSYFLDWWSQALNYLPGSPKPGQNGLINDLRLAITPTTRRQKPHHPPEQCPLERRDIFSNAAGQHIITKCRVQHQNQAFIEPGQSPTTTLTPNYTPTGTDGRPLPTQTIGDGHGGSGQEIIAVTEKCGDIPVGAIVKPGKDTGPNGQIKWLTCGIDPNNNSSGWQPPHATIDQIITFSGGLQAAVKVDNSPFKACTNYIPLFETAGREFKIPPFFIASFALQESGCNPDIDGQGGEQGMMQISVDKCGNAPNGNCKDVVYNVRTAVSYFRNVLDSVNGNVFEAVGSYNGWHRGMSFHEGTTWGVANNCCRCQRNLDYLQQFFNGWLQGIDAWSAQLGSFFNLDVC